MTKQGSVGQYKFAMCHTKEYSTYLKWTVLRFGSDAVKQTVIRYPDTGNVCGKVINSLQSYNLRVAAGWDLQKKIRFWHLGQTSIRCKIPKRDAMKESIVCPNSHREV